MNCKQCGAPMSVEEGRIFFHCDYCGGYEFPDANQDGVSLLDEISPYSCPMCHQPLVAAAVKEVRILSCPHCRGNLIDQSKMLPILSQTKPSEATSEATHSLLNKSELARIVVCPSCQKTMRAYPYGGPGNIIIQGCEECRLIWLDFGELSQIIYSYAQMYKRSSDELGAKKRWIDF